MPQNCYLFNDQGNTQVHHTLLYSAHLLLNIQKIKVNELMLYKTITSLLKN